MKSVQLGKSGLMVSKLCLGCMSFGVPGREPHPWVIDEAASQTNFKVAADAGVYFWDTADMYGAGASEEITGRAMKKYWNKRSDGVLATKLANSMGEGANDKGEPFENLRWSRFKHFEAREMMRIVDEHVFPFLRALGEEGSSYGTHMKDARLGFSSPALLDKVMRLLEHDGHTCNTARR